jgi:hypothetical protein
VLNVLEKEISLMYSKLVFYGSISLRWQNRSEFCLFSVLLKLANFCSQESSKAMRLLSTLGEEMGTIDSSVAHKRIIISDKKSMPTVTCLCGLEILVVPDLRAMNVAIRNHLAEHRKSGDDSEKLDSLEQFLTEGVLIMASKMVLPNYSGKDIARRHINENQKFPKGKKSHLASA